jgi:flagellar hook assembly protein FlgD
LAPNYPNPFNPQTTVDYYLGAPGFTKLTIYNLQGRIVDVLFEEYLPAGPGSAIWNGQDELGAAVASGVYFTRLETANGVQVRKIVLAQ